MTQFRKGMKFVSLRDIRIRGIVSFGAPFSTAFEGVLPRGEVLICDQDSGPRGAWLVPERYEHFEQLFIPEQTRKNPDYGGYAIDCSFNQIGEDYEIVREIEKSISNGR